MEPTTSLRKKIFLASNTSINQVHRLCMLLKTWHAVHNLERRNGLSSWIKQPFNCEIYLSNSLCSMWWIPKNQKSPKILGRPHYPQIKLKDHKNLFDVIFHKCILSCHFLSITPTHISHSTSCYIPNYILH
jgi:hypothetical protein